MSVFDYPIDTKFLLRKKIQLKRELLEADRPWVEKKIAVLGGSTTNEVVAQLELFLLNYGIKPEFYQSEYGKYWEDAMFGNEELDSFNPDLILIYTSWRNITQFPTTSNNETEVESILDGEYQRFESMWQRLHEKFMCPIIQNNFDRPNYRIMGNRDVWDKRGRSNFVFSLNNRFYDFAYKNEYLFINDIDYISAEYGLSAWGESTYWHMYKYACAIDAIPYVAKSIAGIIKSIYGKNKKMLVLDLDNTLWGGIIGDDGVEGISIGPEVPKGQVYSEFQKYCKDLKQIGVILSINSKNEMENALAGLDHPCGVLKKEDFVSIKANWKPKNENIKDLADELSLGMDSFVFVDDNPVERDIVSSQISGIAVPDIQNVEDYIKVLDHENYFETTTLSGEDLKKTEQYFAKAQAAESKALFEDYGEYLDSLDMNAVITGFEPLIVQRVAQLTNKSNQFNLTTLRCSEDDIQKMQNSENHICLAGRLIDKFADNGIVSVVVGEQKGQRVEIKLWLMSCRVLKRGMEDILMNCLVLEAKNRGIEEIIGYYYPTAKNSMVKDFYREYGFSLVEEDDSGNRKWTLSVIDYVEKPIHAIVKRD